MNEELDDWMNGLLDDWVFPTSDMERANRVGVGSSSVGQGMGQGTASRMPCSKKMRVNPKYPLNIDQFPEF